MKLRYLLLLLLIGFCGCNDEQSSNSSSDDGFVEKPGVADRYNSGPAVCPDCEKLWSRNTLLNGRKVRCHLCTSYFYLEKSAKPNSAENTSTQGATDQTTEDQSNDSPNPEIVPPQKTEVKVTHVISSEETYYLDGPQQMRPPDGKFKAGTKVELVQEAGSYSVVVSEDGIRAYVSTGALKPIE